MSNLRKRHILNVIGETLNENPDLEVMDVIRAALRKKNFVNSEGSTHLLATDEEFSRALELTQESLKNE